MYICSDVSFKLCVNLNLSVQYLKNEYPHMRDSEVDSHAFSIMGRVRANPVHVHFAGNLQQMHI